MPLLLSLLIFPPLSSNKRQEKNRYAYSTVPSQRVLMCKNFVVRALKNKAQLCVQSQTRTGLKRMQSRKKTGKEKTTAPIASVARRQPLLEDPEGDTSQIYVTHWNAVQIPEPLPNNPSASQYRPSSPPALLRCISQVRWIPGRNSISASHLRTSLRNTARGAKDVS